MENLLPVVDFYNRQSFNDIYESLLELLELGIVLTYKKFSKRLVTLADKIDNVKSH